MYQDFKQLQESIKGYLRDNELSHDALNDEILCVKESSNILKIVYVAYDPYPPVTRPWNEDIDGMILDAFDVREQGITGVDCFLVRDDSNGLVMDKYDGNSFFHRLFIPTEKQIRDYESSEDKKSIMNIWTRNLSRLDSWENGVLCGVVTEVFGIDDEEISFIDQSFDWGQYGEEYALELRNSKADLKTSFIMNTPNFSEFDVKF